jgi:hypothetical protein
MRDIKSEIGFLMGKIDSASRALHDTYRSKKGAQLTTSSDIQEDTEPDQLCKKV